MSKGKKGRLKNVMAKEAASIGTLAGAGAAYLGTIGSDVLTSVRESIKHKRQAYRTGKDMVTGGPEGMKAAERVESRLGNEKVERLETAVEQGYSSVSGGADRALVDAYDGQYSGVSSLADIYRGNETLARQAKRFTVQLGAGFDEDVNAIDGVANDVTGGAIGVLDNFFMKIAGKGMDGRAREEAAKRKELNRGPVEGFYQGKENLENLATSVLGFIEEDISALSPEKRAALENHLDGVIEQTGRTYEIEDGSVFALRDKISFFKNVFYGKQPELTMEEIGEEGNVVKIYQEDIGEVRTKSEATIPMEPYKSPNDMIDLGVNPLTVALPAALAVRGLFLFPKSVRKGFRNVTAWPATATAGLIGAAYRMGKKALGKKEAKTEEFVVRADEDEGTDKLKNSDGESLT